MPSLRRLAPAIRGAGVLMITLVGVVVFPPAADAQPVAPSSTSAAATRVEPQVVPPARQLSGRVLDAQTTAPLVGASVFVGEARATTDADGRFSLIVPAGRAEVQVVAPGYFPLVTSLDAREADVTGAELRLARDGGFSTSVDVAAEAPGAAPGIQTLQPVQVLRTPGALDNVFRTLQTLPGVAATDEFGSRIAVRGGSPDQNLTMMDGVEIHDPYRLFGLTSAFNPETIQRFELATGGFSVKYGDRLSSLLLVENRDGTAGKGLTGSATLSLTDANVVFEGGLPGGATGSWLVTARRTYYDLVAERLTDQQFPAFADLQARGTWEPAKGRRLTAFVLRSRQGAALSIDEDDARGEVNDDTDNDLAWLRWDMPVVGRGRSRTIVGYSDTRSRLGVDAAFEANGRRSNAPGDDVFGTANVNFERALRIRDWSARQELSWALGAHAVEAGGEVHRLRTGQEFLIQGDRNPNASNGSSVQGGAGLPDALSSDVSTTRGGLWLQDRWQASARLSLEGGLRLDRVGLTQETLLSPRLSGVFTVNPATRVRSAVGQYTQSPGYEKAAQSDYVLDFTNEAVRTLRSERALQAAASIERDVTRGVLLRVEGYYKRFSDLLLGRLETEPERLARIARYDYPADLRGEIPTEALITTVPTNDGRGAAWGMEVYLARTAAPADAKVNGWVSYTWGRGERDSYGRPYPFEYDRRHALSTVASYQLTPRWQAATTVRVASGFPRTAPLGVRVFGAEDTMDLDGDGNTTEIRPTSDANGLPVYGVNFGGVDNLNQARLPVFARTDLRVTWRPRGPSGRWEFYAEVINLFDRRNVGAYDPRLAYNPDGDRPAIVEERDQAIPRLPTVGLRFRF